MKVFTCKGLSRNEIFKQRNFQATKFSRNDATAQREDEKRCAVAPLRETLVASLRENLF
ncbi:MAG: hypothetical protein ACKVU0_16830 [Saprospiraceae bacterium]